MTARGRFYVPASPGFLISLFSLGVVCHGIWFTWKIRTPEAFGDFWAWVAQFRTWQAGHFTISDFIAPLNEHRIATSRAVFLLDSVFDRMNGAFPAIVTLGCLAATGLTIANLAGAGEPHRRRVGGPALFWMAWMMSTCQVDNLQFPLNVCFAILVLLAASSVHVLSASARAKAWQACLGSFCASVLFLAAVFTMAGGMLLAPVHLAVLAMRRAKWWSFACWFPLGTLGASTLFWSHGLLNISNITGHRYTFVDRATYICNFLASSLSGFGNEAGWIGLGALIAFAWLGQGVWRLARQSAVLAEQAALIGIAGFVVLCAVAGTLTARMGFGPASALATRYATLSLLGLACLYVLACKRLGISSASPTIGKLSVLAPCVALCAFNLPIYTREALAASRSIRNNVDLMANDVGVEGPMYLFLGRKTLDLGEDVGFLHRYRLNLFSPAFRPQPATLRAAAHLSSAPPCLGKVEFAYGIDEHAVLIEGWTAWSRKRLVSWVVARDGDEVAGAARPLVTRADIAGALAGNVLPLGFKAGFRVKEDNESGGAREIRLLGVDPENPARLCALADPVRIGPILIAPLQHITGARAIQDPGMISGTRLPRAGVVPDLPSSLADLPFWTTEAGLAGELAFSVNGQSVPAGDDLIIPFSGWADGSDRTLLIRFSDGASIQAALRWPWNKPQMLAAVLPHALLARHPGAISVLVKLGSANESVAGAPLTGVLDPDWSKLF